MGGSHFHPLYMAVIGQHLAQTPAKQLGAAAAKGRCVKLSDATADLLRHRNELGEEVVNIGLCVPRGNPRAHDIARQIASWNDEWMPWTARNDFFFASNGSVAHTGTQPNTWNFSIVEIGADEAGKEGQVLTQANMPKGGWTFLFVLPPAQVHPAAQGTPLHALQCAGRVVRFDDEKWQEWTTACSSDAAGRKAGFEYRVGGELFSFLHETITYTKRRTMPAGVRGRMAPPKPTVLREGSAWPLPRNETAAQLRGFHYVVGEGFDESQKQVAEHAQHAAPSLKKPLSRLPGSSSAAATKKSDSSDDKLESD